MVMGMADQRRGHVEQSDTTETALKYLDGGGHVLVHAAGGAGLRPERDPPASTTAYPHLAAHHQTAAQQGGA